MTAVSGPRSAGHERSPVLASSSILTPRGPLGPRPAPPSRSVADREVRRMRVVRETLTIHTEPGQQFIDITKRVRDAVARLGIVEGLVVVHTLHTTVALFVNEFQPALLHDLGAVLE